MKQRVVVQAIIRRGDTVLLLRRATGRPDLLGTYELPGGRLSDNVQPEDALQAYAKNQLGQEITSIELIDVMSINDQDEAGMQHVFIVYSATNVGTDDTILLGKNHDEYNWFALHEIQQTKLRNSARVLLQAILQIELPGNDIPKVVKNTPTLIPALPHVMIFSDGGSRGNPGDSAAAYVIMDESENIIDQGGEYLGITTNNQAEYHGVQLGLERALELGVTDVDFRMDSLLVVNQMRGIYKIKNRDLWPIHERIKELVLSFNKVSFSHVDRSLNQQADALVNKILDEHTK